MSLKDGLKELEVWSETSSGTNYFAVGSYVDSSGRLRTANVGSPATYGAFVQAGTVVTTAGSSGTIEFGIPFSNTNWFVTLTAGSTGGVNQAYVSGARNVSGAAIVGGPSITYNYIAVGL